MHRAYYKGISDARSRYSKDQIVHGLSKSLWLKAAHIILGFFSDICKPFLSFEKNYLSQRKGLSEVENRESTRPLKNTASNSIWTSSLRVIKEALLNFKENIFCGLIMSAIYNVAYYLEKLRLFIKRKDYNVYQ